MTRDRGPAAPGRDPLPAGAPRRHLFTLDSTSRSVGPTEPPAIEWIAGPRLLTGYATIGLVFATVVFNGFVIFPKIWNSVELGPLLGRLVGGAELFGMVIAAGLFLAVGLPRGGTLGFSGEGILVELGTRAQGVRLAYRWEEVWVRGRWLILRRRSGLLPWYLVLSPAQANRAALGKLGDAIPRTNPRETFRGRLPR